MVRGCIRKHQNGDSNERLFSELENILVKIKELEKVPHIVESEPSEEASLSPPKYTSFEVGQSSNSSVKGNSDKNNDGFVDDVELNGEWDTNEKACLNSLAIFPQNEEVKKILLVRWWMALELLPFDNDQSVKSFFSKLEEKDILQPKRIKEYSQIVDSYTINPKIHRSLIFKFKEKMVIVSKETLLYKDNKGNVIVVLNLNRKQLNSRYNISKKPTIKVLQLGKWRYEDLECQSDNIEVYGKKFWENMEETVAYLSLRGISRIEEIPQSLGKISGLKILDLKDCHSLQKLPQKPKSKIQAALCKDDRWFKELMYLDITGCYLLGHLPKWVCELRNLQVLKGTVFNGMILDQFRLKDLSKLEKLRKLSIKIIHSYLFHPEDCNGLKILRSLVVLTIVWGTHKLERKEQSSDNEKSKTTITLNNSIESAQEEHKSFRSRVKNQGSKTEDDIPLLSFPENLEKLAGHQMLSMF